MEELAIGGEDEERDLDVAENRELGGLLHQPASPLRERHVAAVLVGDSLHLHFPSPHGASDQKKTLISDLFCPSETRNRTARN